MKNFKWQHIEFIDGSNSYICKTKNTFRRMKDHYVLEQISENCWKATFRIGYVVVGFANENEKATFYKGYKTKSGAMKCIKKALEEKRFKQIVFRREEECLKNNDSLDISSSNPIKIFRVGD